MTQFSDLGLAAPLLRALADEGYTTPTPIQQKAIPHVMAGRDLLGIAQTGTGKTAAFALPILHRLMAENRRPAERTARALVLAPTRELAAQIGDSFRAYGAGVRLSVAVVFGGVGFSPQAQKLARGVDVLVATPGRLLDHMDQRTLSLKDTHTVVLDEADHMLDLGFIVPIRRIVGKLPAQRQTLFFSATMPKEIESLAHDMLRDPAQVAVTPVAKTADRVEQQVFLVDSAAAKQPLLVNLLVEPRFERTLIFTRTKRGADRVAALLDKHGVAAAAIHGNKSQSQRERALAAFKQGAVRALVATDIAARGIDVDGVSHVVNYDLPEVPESYVHRIGRTARAGAAGQAIAFCDRAERPLLRAIEKLTRQAIAAREWKPEPGALPVVAAPAAPAHHRPQADRGAPRSHQDRAPHQGKPAPGKAHGKPGHGKPAHGANRHEQARTAPARAHERGEIWSNHGAPDGAGESAAPRRRNRMGQRRRRALQAERAAQAGA